MTVTRTMVSVMTPLSVSSRPASSSELPSADLSGTSSAALGSNVVVEDEDDPETCSPLSSVWIWRSSVEVVVLVDVVPSHGPRVNTSTSWHRAKQSL